MMFGVPPGAWRARWGADSASAWLAPSGIVEPSSDSSSSRRFTAATLPGRSSLFVLEQWFRHVGEVLRGRLRSGAVVGEQAVNLAFDLGRLRIDSRREPDLLHLADDLVNFHLLPNSKS